LASASRDARTLRELQAAADSIDEYLHEVTVEEFKSNAMRRDAVLRNLEVISEASKRLSDEFKAKYPGIPWAVVRAAGNVYRHEYDKLDYEVVWFTATQGLGPLREVLRRALEDLNL
jgi:uncharacterized protein with HEPN domain